MASASKGNDQDLTNENQAEHDTIPDQTEEAKRFTWMDDSPQWGTKAVPSKRGLTLDDINTGFYGEVPSQSEEMTRMPRGARHVPGLPRLEFYSLSKKEEIWADNAGTLYEEAIQRRWIAHLDVPWDSLQPLPRELELAMCQLCTELAQQATTETDSIGQWVGRMNYAYYEVKTFLATELYDTARHYDAFRTRALANGGTLGLESPGLINRRIIESRAGWTETAVLMYILRGTFTLMLYRYGEAYALNPAEKILFRLCSQDKARHLGYGMAHVKYAITQKGDDYALGLLRMMRGVEQDLVTEMKDPVIWEAMAIVCGGGLENISFGMDVVKGFQRRYVNEYIARMRWVGIDKTLDNLVPDLASYVKQGGAQETSLSA
ncbi:uncharacterized protein METZ01_LOCUS22912 [marine metagenome]|uniref:Ferritin-like domain-containing protein n=1 Tax=marine metagenome TaxID=408172 RepID=A0A381PU60_9ZZZZ